MLRRDLYNCKIIFNLILLVALFFSIPSFAFEKSSTLNLDSTDVSWKKLLFKAEEFFVELTAEVELTSSPSSEINNSLISTSKGTPFTIKGSETLVIDTRILIESILGDLRLRKAAWFNPVDLSTLQYLRQRTGLKDSNKIYRFTNEGVFRLAKHPIDKSEALKLPEEWSQSNEKFYPYEQEVDSCSSVTAPIPLIYLVSTLKSSDFIKPVTVCVFNKKETVYLDIQYDSAESVQLDHVELKEDKILHRNTLVLADVLSLKARSILSGMAIEGFTLLGLQGNIRIYIDRESRIPVQLEGSYKGLGQIKLNLHKVVHH
tara:strand:+ start:152 stop:1102 length:951 start_codon:yes stop_codon:yes gene_type:complete